VADSPDIAAADTICAIRKERDWAERKKGEETQSINQGQINIYRLKKVKYCL
jgi:hypothetical protein